MRFALGQSRRCGTERRMLDEVSLAGGAADGQQGSAGQKDAAGEVIDAGQAHDLEQLTALLNTVPLEISFIDTEKYQSFLQ